MNSNRKLTINFLINGELDHVIKSKKGKSIKHRATKKRDKIFKKDAIDINVDVEDTKEKEEVNE